LSAIGSHNLKIGELGKFRFDGPSESALPVFGWRTYR